jgi:bifunctional ADP-heptose synthase (sugar kinase/adenylyltransferase)
MTVQQKQLNALVIGDVCIDEYVYTYNTRVNPEAPTLLLNQVEITRNTGMADNVSRCLENLGFEVHAEFPDSTQWGTKTRYVDKKTNQILFRVDIEEKVEPFTPSKRLNLNSFDAVVVSDYCKGFVTYDTLDWLCKEYDGPIFLDTKKRELSKYTRCFIKINEHEANALSRVPPHAIVTMGNRGVVWYNERWPAFEVSAVDVCGAGDAFLAGIVYGFLNDEINMIEYGVVNAGLSVQHVGTYSPSLNELTEGMKRYALQCGNC